MINFSLSGFQFMNSPSESCVMKLFIKLPTESKLEPKSLSHKMLLFETVKLHIFNRATSLYSCVLQPCFSCLVQRLAGGYHRTICGQILQAFSPTWSCFTLCTAPCLRGERRSLTIGKWLLFTTCCWTAGSNNFCCWACMAAIIWREEKGLYRAEGQFDV